jgi:hypothetical protein
LAGVEQADKWEEREIRDNNFCHIFIYYIIIIYIFIIFIGWGRKETAW